jgi:AmmeMemoRadiSam system protein A
MLSRPEATLNFEERQALLALARLAVVEAVVHTRLPEAIPKHGVFAERKGVFVTLHVRGRLRGCIGIVEGHEPLGDGIVHAAASAAIQDQRFSRLREDELDELRIEVSILSSLVPIRPEEVEIGRHGLLVVSGGNRGLLLPQVAAENRLDREQFLEETCRKAGLPRHAWRESDVVLFGFTCEIYSDEATLAG